MIRAALAVTLLIFASAGMSQTLLLTEEEIDQVLSHGPWPMEIEPDPSNRVSGNPAAVALGERLFFSEKLSRNGGMSCATCHDPARNFTDGRASAIGARSLPRNTPTLTNVRFHRWFGWDGSTDNLWAQSFLPILNPEEMGLTTGAFAALATRPNLATDYKALFGTPDPSDQQTIAINLAKALAAFQETLTTDQTPFDRFRDALAADDIAAASTYPAAAQRGLSLFIGRGKCNFCHSGPLFSNGEFHDAGVPYFLPGGGVDEGRFRGLKRLKESPYTLDSRYNDDPTRAGAWAVRQVQTLHSDFGTFRVPSLRGVARTAPYMHDGSLPDLQSVVRHYAEINLERLHADGESILVPFVLKGTQAADLEAFLQSLSVSE